MIGGTARFGCLLVFLLLSGLLLAGCMGEDAPAEEVENAVPLGEATPEATREGTPVPTVVEPEVASGELILLSELDGLVRASVLASVPVWEEGGTQDATITHILVDFAGDIQYIVFDAAPFLGLENRLVALPWEPALLAADPGFLGLFYLGDETRLEDSPVPDADLLAEGAVTYDPVQLGLHPVTDKLIDVGRFGTFELVNTAGEDLGAIEDILLDTASGRAAYAVVNVGSFLEVERRNLVVPWDQMYWDIENDFFVLPVDRAVLEAAPAVGQERLDDPVVELEMETETQAFWENVPRTGTGG